MNKGRTGRTAAPGGEKGKAKKGAKPTEFECPLCSSPNIYSDGISDKDEIGCMYCGAYFIAKLDEELNLKLDPQ